MPEAERRLDVTVFAKSEQEANRISNRIHRYIRRGREEQLLDGTITEICLPSLFSAGGPIDILERDVKLPGVFRSYYVIYDEDEDEEDDCP